MQRNSTKNEWNGKSKLVTSFDLARPDASDRDVSRMLEDSRQGSAFAQEMLSSRVVSQRRVLQEVESRQQEMRKMEQSIEELAILFTDLQVLLEVLFTNDRPNKNKSIPLK